MGFQGTGLVEVISSSHALQPQLQRWKASWGFEVDPLLQLSQPVPDYDRGAQPFED